MDRSLTGCDGKRALRTGEGVLCVEDQAAGGRKGLPHAGPLRSAIRQDGYVPPPLSSTSLVVQGGSKKTDSRRFDCVDVFHRGGTRPNSHNRPFRDSVLHSVGSPGSVPQDRREVRLPRLVFPFAFFHTVETSPFSKPDTCFCLVCFQLCLGFDISPSRVTTTRCAQYVSSRLVSQLAQRRELTLSLSLFDFSQLSDAKQNSVITPL